MFAAYQYEILQTPYWEPEAAFAEVRRRVSVLDTELGVREERPRWPVSLERVQQAAQFRDCRELFLHSVEEGDADRLVGFALSEARRRRSSCAATARTISGCGCCATPPRAGWPSRPVVAPATG